MAYLGCFYKHFLSSLYAGSGYFFLLLLCYVIPGPEVIKLFSYSTQLSMNYILLINVKMPTIVGILTFISMINTTSEGLKAEHFFICLDFSFYEQLKFHAMNFFYNLGAWSQKDLLLICIKKANFQTF